MTALTQPRLVGSGLAIRRGPRFLFRNLDIVLAPGDVVQLTGPNGSGKSTLLRMLAGFSPPDAGTVVVDGVGQSEATALIQYFGHREGLRAALTARENLTFLAALLGGNPQRIPEVLSRLGILRLEHLPVRVLSEGQRRRVALARLLLAPRPIWLLDEPLASLDIEAIGMVSTLIADHAAAGGMALVATHQPLASKNAVLDLAGRREAAA